MNKGGTQTVGDIKVTMVRRRSLYGCYHQMRYDLTAGSLRLRYRISNGVKIYHAAMPTF